MDVALQAARIAIQTPFKDVARASSSIGDEISYGQWCLPLLISSAPSRALIDWDFTPRQVEARAVSQKINTVVMPARFIGRRAEMRKYKNSLLAGKIHSLLITGPGGQGKTSLAGKLALDLQAHGYRLFAWSARPENSRRDFELEMEQALDRPRVDRYDKFLPRAENESARAQFLLDLLMEQFNGRVALFLDNLETIQDPDTLALKDTTVEAWLRAANQAQGMISLVTSRWQIPDWDGEHEPLTHVNYGDFLQIAQRFSLPPAFLTRRNSLRQVYDILGGNVRGLEFFAAAMRDMENTDEENAFLEKLSAVKEDLQANMAIETIYNRLPADAKTLLHRLPAFHEPVPMEGLLKLAPDLPNPESLLERLLAVSLLEASYEPHWKVNEYQCPQMVVEWMNDMGLMDDGHEWLNIVADYHLGLFENERKVLPQAIAVHHALRRAKRHSEADKLTLDYIVDSLKLGGFYTALLNDWLPRIYNSEDLKTRDRALAEAGILLTHIGDYKTALAYHNQALVITRQRNDSEGEAAALNNISQIYQAQGDYDAALTHLKQSLTICQQIGDKKSESVTINNIANIYSAQGNYEIALDYRKKDLSICQQIGDKAGESTTLNNIAQILFRMQGDTKTALAYLKQSLAIFQQIGDIQGQGTALGNIAALYHAQGSYEVAISYMKQSLVIFQKIGDRIKEGIAINNISQIYYVQGDYETALIYLNQSLAIERQLGDKAGEGTALNNISQIYHAQNDIEMALTYARQSLSIRQQIGDKAGMCSTLFSMGHIYMQNKQAQDAAIAWVNSYQIAKQIKHAQILQALTELAPEGLNTWEQLTQRMQSGSK
jgi:tetratricopeptide (TPR) repeat protein